MSKKQIEQAIIEYDRFLERAFENGAREVHVEDVPDKDVPGRVRVSCASCPSQEIDGLSTAMICLRDARGYQAVKVTFCRNED